MLVACECVCLQEAEDAGEDYERQKMLQTSASELERKQRKRKKKNPDTGFAGELHSLSLSPSTQPSLLPLSPPSYPLSHTLALTDYAQAQFRQYDRLTKQLKPDMEIYEKQKMEM